MSRIRKSLYTGFGLLLVLWGLSVIGAPAHYLLFPGEALGSVLFGHDQPIYFVVTFFVTNWLCCTALSYIALWAVSRVRTGGPSFRPRVDKSNDQ